MCTSVDLQSGSKRTLLSCVDVSTRRSRGADYSPPETKLGRFAAVSDIFSRMPRTENEVSKFRREPVGDELWTVVASNYPKMHRLARALLSTIFGILRAFFLSGGKTRYRQTHIIGTSSHR